MTDLTQEQIDVLAKEITSANISEGWAKAFILCLSGYFKSPLIEGDTLEGARQYFFRSVQLHLERENEQKLQTKESA